MQARNTDTKSETRETATKRIHDLLFRFLLPFVDDGQLVDVPTDRVVVLIAVDVDVAESVLQLICVNGKVASSSSRQLSSLLSTKLKFKGVTWSSLSPSSSMSFTSMGDSSLVSLRLTWTPKELVFSIDIRSEIAPSSVLNQCS